MSSYRDGRAFLNYDDELSKRRRRLYRSISRADAAINRTNMPNEMKALAGQMVGSAVGSVSGAAIGRLLVDPDLEWKGVPLRPHATGWGGFGGGYAGRYAGRYLATGGPRGRIHSAAKTSAKMRQRGEITDRQQEALDRYNIVWNTPKTTMKQRRSVLRGVREEFKVKRPVQQIEE